MKKNKEIVKKENVGICGICHKIIFTNVDDYVHLEDYKAGHFLTEGWYHLSCWNEKLKSYSDMNLMKQKTMALLKKAGEMIGMGDEHPTEVIKI